MAEQSQLSQYTKSYTSMSGVDITAVFDGVPIGTLQGGKS